MTNAINRERQSRADSFMEAATNIAVGMVVSQAANLVVLPLVLGVQVSQGAAFSLGVIYTAISLVRQYVLRRAFNGRSVWQAIKGAGAGVKYRPSVNERAAAIADAVAERCHRPRKPGQAPQRYAVIWQAARLGAIEALDGEGADA